VRGRLAGRDRNQRGDEAFRVQAPHLGDPAAGNAVVEQPDHPRRLIAGHDIAEQGGRRLGVDAPYDPRDDDLDDPDRVGRVVAGEADAHRLRTADLGRGRHPDGQGRPVAGGDFDRFHPAELAAPFDLDAGTRATGGEPLQPEDRRPVIGDFEPPDGQAAERLVAEVDRRRVVEDRRPRRSAGRRPSHPCSAAGRACGG